MAYSSQSGSESNTLPWVIGGLAVLYYLWYNGYLSSSSGSGVTGGSGGGGTTPTSTDSGSVPVTSVASGATTPTVNQAAGTSTVSSVASGTTPAVGTSQSVTDLANESYYSWLASGAPLSTLEQIDAAASMVESGYIAANTPTSTGINAPATSVASASPTTANPTTVTPTTTQVNMPSAPVSASTPAWVSNPSLDPNIPKGFQGPDLAQIAALTGSSISGDVMTYPTGISYKLNSDGSMTMLTPSTAVQAANAAKATPYAGYVNPYLNSAASAVVATPSNPTSVASGSTTPVTNTGARRVPSSIPVASPPLIVTGKLSSSAPSRTSVVSNSAPTHVNSANANRATSVVSATPSRGK